MILEEDDVLRFVPPEKVLVHDDLVRDSVNPEEDVVHDDFVDGFVIPEEDVLHGVLVLDFVEDVVQVRRGLRFLHYLHGAVANHLCTDHVLPCCNMTVMVGLLRIVEHHDFVRSHCLNDLPQDVDHAIPPNFVVIVHPVEGNLRVRFPNPVELIKHFQNIKNL